jgi:hypothetical protein
MTYHRRGVDLGILMRRLLLVAAFCLFSSSVFAGTYCNYLIEEDLFESDIEPVFRVDGEVLIGFQSLWSKADSMDKRAYSLVYESENVAYYYFETCENCGELLRCDKVENSLADVASAAKPDCPTLKKLVANEKNPGKAIVNACR